MGLGSSRLNSDPRLFCSSSKSAMEGCLTSTKLIMLVGDDEELVKESRECVDCEDAEDERRNDDRRLFREKRWRMVWKREVCILTDFSLIGLGWNE